MQHSGVTLAGGVCGALLYGLAEEPIRTRLANRGPKLGALETVRRAIP